MFRINNFHAIVRRVLLTTLIFLMAGCATHQARQAFEDAEQYAAEEKFDLAVEKYFEASQKDPGKKAYKLKLIATRTRAAAYHIKRARALSQTGKIKEALTEYRLARGFDPGLEIAAQEEQVLLNKLKASSLVDEAKDYYRQRRLSFVQKTLDKALALDPQNPEALALEKVLQRERETIAMDGIELDVASDDPITLRFKDARIDQVFGILHQLTGINFILDEEVRNQSISVLLEKASFAQAMQLILQMNGLEKKVLNSKTIIIYPQTKNKEKQYEDHIIQTFYLSHIDAKKAVNMLRTMLQLRKIYVHEERNALVIRDEPDVIRLAEQILDAADRENSEVIFDIEIVTVSDSSELNLGPELSTYSSSLGFANPGGSTIVNDTLSPGSSTGNLVSGLSNLETFYTLPTATFEYAKTLQDAEILASPKIRVRNKEKAKVHIGTREPVITVTTTGDVSTDSIQYVDVGVKVDIEPNIQLNKSVETKLTLEISRVVDRFETNNGSVALTIQTTNAQSVLTLKDGVQTVLGGLLETESLNTKKTFPVIGDIPVLGDILSNHSNQDTKREVLLSITPYIIKNVEVPEFEVATIWSGGEDNLKSGPNFGAFAEPLVSEIESTRPVPAPSLSEQDEIEPEELRREEVRAQVPTKVLASSATTPPEILGTEEIDIKAEESSPPEENSQGEGLPETEASRLDISGPQIVEEGAEFVLTVKVVDVQGLFSAPLFFSYNPEMLELVNVIEGSFLEKEGETTVFSSRPNRETGQVIVGYKQVSGGKGATGSGVLFDVTFRAKVPGATEIILDRVNFRTPEGGRLSVSPATFTVEIR